MDDGDTLMFLNRINSKNNSPAQSLVERTFLEILLCRFIVDEDFAGY